MFSFHVNGSIVTSGKAILLLILIQITTTGWLNASISTQSIPFGMSCPETLLSVNESVSFSVWAGSANQALSDIVGFDITLNVSEDAQFPTSFSPDFTESWLGEASDLTVSVDLDASERSIHIFVQRNQTALDGYGELFSFSLLSAEDEVWGNQLLTAGGGIIITIEDVILRQAAPSSSGQYAPILFPNPSNHMVQIAVPGEEVAAIQLWNLTGKKVARLKKGPIYWKSLGLLPGRYWVQIQLVSGKVIRESLIFMP